MSLRVIIIFGRNIAWTKLDSEQYLGIQIDV